MNETTKKVTAGILIAVFFAAMVSLIVVGHRNIGLGGLGLELLGLSGLIFLLWLYNRQYK